MPWLEALWEEVDDFQQRVDAIILKISPPVDAKFYDYLTLNTSTRFEILLETTDPSLKR